MKNEKLSYQECIVVLDEYRPQLSELKYQILCRTIAEHYLDGMACDRDDIDRTARLYKNEITLAEAAEEILRNSERKKQDKNQTIGENNE